MSFPTLTRGDRGEEVRQLQRWLNRIGAMLVTDGIFGGGSVAGVVYAQDIAGQATTGVADPELWAWLEQKPEPFPPLHTEGVSMIAREETGGLRYYDQHTRLPHYPGEASGITIGVGYDLRFNTEANFRALWSPHLPADMIEELVNDIGRRGTKQRSRELVDMDFQVPFKAAWPVFIEKTLPRFYDLTVGIYSSLPRLPPLCRSVLVSLVFNRGTKLGNSDNRREMRNIRDILAQADNPNISKTKKKQILRGVEDEIVSMKRLWNAGSGLVKRRQTEANMWSDGLHDW